MRQPYKTFYGCNLRLFLLSYSVCPRKTIQLSLMFVGKAGAYLRVKYLSGPDLPANNKAGRACQELTNTLAYYKNS